MKNQTTSKSIGICAHSYEGGALCFLEICRKGAAALGAHMHPSILMSAIPMGLSMPHWDKDEFDEVGDYLKLGIEQVAAGGANFFLCPDNTAHLVLESIIDQLPLPGLHIAQVVCHKIASQGWKKVGLLGTNWTMLGSVYEKALAEQDLEKIVPPPLERDMVHSVIFDELCQGIFKKETIKAFIDTILLLKKSGAECVILGCTEIPLIINSDNSPLPILDSTRLLAEYAVWHAISNHPCPSSGWIKLTQ